jgi:N-acyl-D-amino-acid deacylase
MTTKMLQAHNTLNNDYLLDLLIVGATIIDGSGAAGYIADVGISNSRVVEIGNLNGFQAIQRIDAKGLTLAPGFIDCHSHDDCAVLDAPDMLAKISQGVTTVINGNCGLSLAPLSSERVAQLSKPLIAPLSLFSQENAYSYPNMAAYRQAFETNPAMVNVAQLVGHATLRAAVMQNLDVPASTDELAQMAAEISAAISAGCLGLSAGLAYKSSSAASTDELISLARTVAAHDGIFTVHLRCEGTGIVASVAEAIRIALESKVAIVVSHHKCVGKNAWGLTEQTLTAITAARTANPELTLNIDCYPYTASSTVLMAERILNATKTILTYSLPYPEMAGRDFADITHEWGLSIDATIAKLAPAGAVYFNLHEDDLLRVLKFGDVMIGSDGLSTPVSEDRHASTAQPHPRLWGTFPRVLGHYVRERGVLSLQEAIHRMTGVPARTFGLANRGEIRVGAYADLVLFDANTILDRATFTSPTQPSQGIVGVWVNGSKVWNGAALCRENKHAKRPGRWLTRSASTTALTA